MISNILFSSQGFDCALKKLKPRSKNPILRSDISLSRDIAARQPMDGFMYHWTALQTAKLDDLLEVVQNLRFSLLG